MNYASLREIHRNIRVLSRKKYESSLEESEEEKALLGWAWEAGHKKGAVTAPC